MKENRTKKQRGRSTKTFTAVCLASCQRLLARMEKIKDAIVADFQKQLGGNDWLLRRALSEAEAVAWQTDYPHLFFPELAWEKAESVAAWNARQRSILGLPSSLPLAA